MCLDIKKEVLSTIVSLIGAKFYKGDDRDFTKDMHYRFANSLLKKSEYNAKELNLLLIYAVALVDSENYEAPVSPELKSILEEIKRLKNENYTAEDIVYIFRTKGDSI